MKIYLAVDPISTTLDGVIPILPDAMAVESALVIGALTEGDTVIRTQGLVHSPTVDGTVQALEQLGVPLTVGPRGYVVYGRTSRFPRVTSRVTLGRAQWELPLVVGVASRMVAGPTTFESVAEAWETGPEARQLLNRLGLSYTLESGGRAIRITPGPLQGGTWRVPAALAHWVAPLLLIAPLASDPVTIVAEAPGLSPAVWGTHQLMRAFGIFLDQNDAEGWWHLAAPQPYRPTQVLVGPDTAQAVFWMVLAALHAGSWHLTQLGALALHPVIRPMCDLLRAMGAPFQDSAGGLSLTQSRPSLHGGHFDLSHLSAWLPLLAAAAAVVDGPTTFDGIEAAVLANPQVGAIRHALTEMGATIEATSTRWTIHGQGHLPGGGTVAASDAVTFLAWVLVGTVTDQPLSVTPDWRYLGHHPDFLNSLDRVGIGTTLHAGHLNFAPAN